MGLYIFFVIYTGSALGGICGPIVSKYITGIKWSVILSSIGFIGWYISLIFEINWTIIASSIIMGLLLSIYVSQLFVWLASMPIHHQSNYYAGIFNFVFGLSGIIGAVIPIGVFVLNYNFTHLLYICTGISFMMTLALVCSMNRIKFDSTQEVGLHLYLDILKLKMVWLFHPIIIYNASCIILTFGVIPKFFNGDLLTVSYYYLIYGIIYSIWCYVMQYIYRRFYSNYLLVICILCLILIYLYLILNIYINLPSYLIYVLSLFTAINDSTIKTISTIESNKYFNEYKAIFGLSRSVYSISCAIFSIIAIYVTWYYYLTIMVCMLAIAIVMYVWLKSHNNTTLNQLKEMMPLLV